MTRVSFYMQIIWKGMFCQSGNYMNRGCLQSSSGTPRPNIFRVTFPHPHCTPTRVHHARVRVYMFNFVLKSKVLSFQTAELISLYMSEFNADKKNRRRTRNRSIFGAQEATGLGAVLSEMIVGSMGRQLQGIWRDLGIVFWEQNYTVPSGKGLLVCIVKPTHFNFLLIPKL